MIAMLATLKVKEGHEADFEAAAKKLAEAVRANEPGNQLYQLCKIGIRMDGFEIRFNHSLHLQISQNRFVLVMRMQLTSSCKLFGINGMWLDIPYSCIGNDRHDHEWNNQFVSTGHFRNNKYPRKGSVHNTAYHSSHSNQCKVTFGKWRSNSR